VVRIQLIMVVDREARGRYMEELWKQIESPSQSLPDYVTECRCLDFEAKLNLGWPDPR